MTTATRRTSDPLRTLRALVGAGSYQEALDFHRRLGGAPRPEALLLAAAAAIRTGELAAGTSYAAEALEHFRSRGDDDGRMRALNLLGVVSFERGRLAEAERCFGEALRLAHQLDDSLLAARASNNLASVAHLRALPEEAQGLYRSALLAYQRLGDRRGMAETWHNLGLTLRQLAGWREALAASSEALRHARAVGEAGLLSLVLVGRAEIEIDRRELDLARQPIERASLLAAEAGDEVAVAEVGRLRALFALRREDYSTALAEASAAHAVALRHESALLGAECLALMACALGHLGRRAEAHARRVEALAAFGRLGARSLMERFERDWECVPTEATP
jgi:tetratricopeptide (TPR) repeat protein